MLFQVAIHILLVMSLHIFFFSLYILQGFFTTKKILKNTYIAFSFIFASSLPGKLIGTDWFYLLTYQVP